MTVQFDMIPLADLIKQSNVYAEIDPDRNYRQVTVKLWGKGVELRNEVEGTSIIGTKLFIARENQFILSKIDARNGAFGIIPSFLDKAVVSADFPVFTLNTSKVLPSYLNWISKTADFVNLCVAASEGTTNRVRLKIDRFLVSAIPLPPLEEQRRIVARIEEVAAKIEEARGLQKQVYADLDTLCRSIFFDSTKKELVSTPMRDLVHLREPNIFVNPEDTYHFAGIYSFGRGMFKGQQRSGTEFSYTKLTSLKTNNFVYPKLMAWEGALALVPPECDGLVVSPEFPVFEINQDRVLPETLEVYFRSSTIWPLLSGASTGTNVRRKRLNPSDFLAFKMPLPSMETQILLKKVSQRASIIKQHQAETSAELDALLPSIFDKAFKGEL